MGLEGAGEHQAQLAEMHTIEARTKSWPCLCTLPQPKT